MTDRDKFEDDVAELMNAAKNLNSDISFEDFCNEIAKQPKLRKASKPRMVKGD